MRDKKNSPVTDSSRGGHHSDLYNTLFHYQNQKREDQKDNNFKGKKMYYKRATTLTSYDDNEDNSGLLVLWIVLGVIGIMFGFMLLSYLVNYILYNNQTNFLGTSDQNSIQFGTTTTTTTTMNPMGIMNFGHNHNQQILSKEDLDKCPVFKFKNNKKYQYKNSNSKNNILLI